MKNGFVSVSPMGDMYVNVNYIQYLDIEIDSFDVIHVFAYFIGREKVCICSTADMEDAILFIEDLLKTD